MCSATETTLKDENVLGENNVRHMSHPLRHPGQLCANTPVMASKAEVNAKLSLPDTALVHV